MNGYDNPNSSGSQENGHVTVISIDSDPALNSKTNNLVEEQTMRTKECVFEASEVVQVCDGSDMCVVQEESTSFCSVETVTVEEHSMASSESSMSDDVGFGSPVAFTGAAAQDCSEGLMSCAAEIAQDDMKMCIVECVESVQEEFEVATVDSDDSVSVCSLGSTENVVQTHSIVMECGQQIVEEVPMSPQEKAVIRRG